MEKWTFALINESMYLRMNQTKFVEDSFLKIWSDMICLGKPHYFKFFKGCLPHISLGPFFNALIQLCLENNLKSNKYT